MVESSEKLNNQAVSFAAKGQYEEAIACLKRAITVEKTNHLLWFNLSLTYRDMGKLKNAVDCMIQSLSCQPENEEVIESLAGLFLHMNNTDEAMKYAYYGMHVNGRNPHFWNLGGVAMFKTADYECACEMFEEAVSIDPYYYDALFNLKDCYEEMGNVAGMEECARKMKDIDIRGNK